MKATREMADRLVLEGLVKAREVGPYTIFKYAAKVFYDRLWTPELELFRGTVFKGDKLVVEPMRKVYNYGENGTGLALPLDTPVILDYKVNGFMLNVTCVDGELLFSTTGSLDSPFVELGKNMFYHWLTEDQINGIRLYNDHTFTFEVCSPEDPHIIKEDYGLHLLHISNHSLIERNYFANKYGFKYHKIKGCTLGEALELAKLARYEGWMVYDGHGNDLLFKLKTTYYLTTKFLMRSVKASDAIYGPNPKEVFKDEEFFKLVEWIKANMTQEFWDAGTDQRRREWIEEFFNKTGAF